MDGTKNKQEELYVQVLGYKHIQGRVKNRCWIQVSDGNALNFCLLKPHLNYFIKNMSIQKFTVIRAKFQEVKQIYIKKVLQNLYQLPQLKNEMPLFFVEDIHIEIPGDQIGYRIIFTLKKLSILKLANVIKNPMEVQQLEIPKTLMEDINIFVRPYSNLVKLLK
jgi:hypothetical protein